METAVGSGRAARLGETGPSVGGAGERLDRRLPAEDADRREDQRLEDGPADERKDRGDVEDRPAGLERVRVQDSFEGRDEQLARVQDELHQVIALTRVQQEQNDAQDDQDLDDPKDEHHDAAGDFAAARAARDPALDDAGATAVDDRTRLLVANDAFFVCHGVTTSQRCRHAGWRDGKANLLAPLSRPDRAVLPARCSGVTKRLVERTVARARNASDTPRAHTTATTAFG